MENENFLYFFSGGHDGDPVAGGNCSFTGSVCVIICKICPVSLSGKAPLRRKSATRGRSAECRDDSGRAWR